ncbi:MAG: cryptochrome/photolyase family protein, partial [Proteobacteria bacterium]
MANKAFLVLGNQLFDPKLLGKRPGTIFFLREDTELCVHFKYHKLKIALFLNAMRSYADELRAAGHEVIYEELEKSKKTYEQHLADFLRREKIKEIEFYEIEDKFFETRILELFSELGVAAKVLPSPMFLTSREQFKDYLGKYKKPFMKNFYELQRRRLKVLVDEKGKPTGGQW